MKRKMIGGLAVIVFASAVCGQIIKIRRINLQNFPEITALVSVENETGAPVPVDTAKFQLFEQGRPIPAVKVIPQDSQAAPIYTVIVLDKSGSMKSEPIKKARAGAAAFVGLMKGKDQCAYIAFDTSLYQLSDFTSDKAGLRLKINSTTTGSDTALLDAIMAAIRLYQSVPAEAVKIILVLTDGRENRSRTRLDDIIKAATADSILIYTIGLGKAIDEAMLKSIAEKTNANYYQAPAPEMLVQIYRKISLLLHSQLAVTFNTPFPMDDRWHNLKIVLPYLGKEITSERGYLSAKESRISQELLKKIQDEGGGQAAAKTSGKIQGLIPTGGNKLVIILAATLGVLLTALVLLIIRRKKR